MFGSLRRFARVLGLSVEPLDPPVCVETPVGDGVVLSRVCKACEIRVADLTLVGDFIVLDMATFDVILGMDWLTRHQAVVDCLRWRVTVTSGESTATCTLSNRRGGDIVSSFQN